MLGRYADPYSGTVHEWVADAAGKVTVVLGAGASRPAGLPTSRELTKIVFDALDERSRDPQTWAFVRKHVPGESVDVEQLWRSLEDLRRVLAGHSPWLGLVSIPPAVTAKSIADIQFNILDVTVSSLRNGSVGAPTGYLESLVRADLVGIATLNFDTLVETAAAAVGARVKTGADEWEGGYSWPIPRNATPLLKIHGSLDWYSVVRGAGPIPRSGLETISRDEELRYNGRGIFSDLRFGLENKLTQDGAMPALLTAFSEILSESELVVAVGYGFRDVHVDVALDRWAEGDNSRRLLVVDPTRDPDDLEALEKSGSEWFGHTVAGLRHDVWTGQERVRIIDESAETAFDRLFG